MTIREFIQPNRNINDNIVIQNVKDSKTLFSGPSTNIAGYSHGAFMDNEISLWRIETNVMHIFIKADVALP